MISDKILRFRQLNTAQRTAVELDSAAQVKQLDEQISELWEQILHCRPETDEQRVMLVNFLFSEISISNGLNGKFGQVQRMMIDLVKRPEPVERPPLLTYRHRLFRLFGMQNPTKFTNPALVSSNDDNRCSSDFGGDKVSYNSMQAEKW